MWGMLWVDRMGDNNGERGVRPLQKETNDDVGGGRAERWRSIWEIALDLLVSCR